MARKQIVTPEDDGIYAKMGRAALLPGLTRAIEVLNAERDSLMLALGSAGVSRDEQAAQRRNDGIAAYWAKFSPEQRSAEMSRRYRVSITKAAAAVEPQKKNPGNGSWWAKLTPAEKAAHVLKTAAARKANQKKLAKQLLNGHAKKETRASA